MNRQQVKALHKEMDAVLERFAAEKGVAYLKGNGSYDDTTCSFKVNFAEIDLDGQVASKEAKDFETYKQWNKLSHANIGDTFISKGRVCEIVGWRSRAKRYPVLCRLEDGREIAFPAAMVAMKLNEQKGS